MPNAKQKEVADDAKDAKDGKGGTKIKFPKLLSAKQKQPPKEAKTTQKKQVAEKTIAADRQKRRKGLPKAKLKVSLGTLLELEKWAEKARSGKRRDFRPVVYQININGDDLYDTIHALTLAQIMPYQEVWRHWKLHTMSIAPDNFELVEKLAEKYNTGKRNVVERLHHVRMLNRYYEEQKNPLKTDGENGEEIADAAEETKEKA